VIQGHRQILPVYGEGDREAVEGGVRLSDSGAHASPPSVSPAAIHVPVNGEDLG
jgi:hypothetical protein